MSDYQKAIDRLLQMLLHAKEIMEQLPDRSKPQTDK